MNRLEEKKLGTAPDNPNMRDINDITASTQEKTRSDTEQFRKFYGTNVLQVIQYLIQLCQQKIYTTPTLLFAQIQIQRKYPLFIGGFSNLAFFHLTDGATQTNNLMPNGLHNSGSRIGDELTQKAKNELKSGTNDEQY